VRNGETIPEESPRKPAVWMGAIGGSYTKQKKEKCIIRGCGIIQRKKGPRGDKGGKSYVKTAGSGGDMTNSEKKINDSKKKFCDQGPWKAPIFRQ